MNRFHQISLAYLIFGATILLMASVGAQNGEFLIHSPTDTLGSLLFLVGGVVMIAISVGTFKNPEWHGQETISALHLLSVWVPVLLVVGGFALELAPVAL